MQSKASKNRNGRNANAAEKRFHSFVKHHPCIWCGSESGSIVDHVIGAKQGFNKVHIGHWFTLPNCAECDYKKTELGQKLGDYSKKWVEIEARYRMSGNRGAPVDVWEAIQAWGETWKNGK